MRVGLVLAAGGSVGVAYHGGVLAALEEATGWDPRRADLVVGTSAGSVTASLLRAGLPARDLAAISEGAPLSDEGERLASSGRPHRPRVKLGHALSFRPWADLPAVLHAATHPWSSSPRRLLVAALPAGGIPTSAISEGIDTLHTAGWPVDPLWICAWDLRRGHRVVFGRPGAPVASVGEAVAASSAIPAYFQPVSIGGRRYVDGGVHSMANLDLAAGAGLDLVIVVSPLTAVSSSMSPAGVLRQPLRATLRSEVDTLRAAGVEVVAVQPGRSVATAMGPNPMDAARRQVVSEATREGVRRWLSDGVDGRRLARILAGASGRVPGMEGLPSA